MTRRLGEDEKLGASSQQCGLQGRRDKDHHVASALNKGHG